MPVRHQNTPENGSSTDCFSPATQVPVKRDRSPKPLPTHGFEATACPLQWTDALDALRWAIEALERQGGYAKTSMVPNMPRLPGIPYHEIQDLALTIRSKAETVEPPEGKSIILAASGRLRFENQHAFDAAENLQRYISKSEEYQLDTVKRYNLALVAVMRICDETENPKAKRRPPMFWYAKAGNVSRETIYRRQWRKLIQELETTCREWRDSAERHLTEKLSELGALR